MNEDLQTAIVILLVGMTTVFVILFLVVLTGNTLIRIINHFFPVPISETITRDSFIPVPPATPSLKVAKLAAIVAAVEMVTAGKGKIEKIENLEQ